MFYVSAKVVPEDSEPFEEPKFVAFKVAAGDGDTALTMMRSIFRRQKVKVVRWVRCAPFDASKQYSN